MKEARNSIRMQCRRGLGYTHHVYLIADKYGKRTFQRREAALNEVLNALTPYLHGTWQDIEINITARSENYGNETDKD